MKALGMISVAAFVATIVLANALTTHFGFVAVGFGLTATAGTYAAGLALSLRDAVHETLGRMPVVGAILAGALLTWWISPAFAVASGTAFLVSEMADLAVYTPIRERSRYGGVLASNSSEPSSIPSCSSASRSVRAQWREPGRVR